MPTMGLAMERLATGAATRPQRSTANHVFVVVEGSGESTIGKERFAWTRGDTFVAPSWNRYEHRASADAQLFDMSDEPLMRFGRFYRVETW